MLRRLFVLTLLVFWFQAPAAAETVVLPIRLDYPLVRAFFVQQLFNEPGEVATLVNREDACQSIIMREPTIEPHGNFLRVRAKMEVRTGVPVFDNCVMPMRWDGNIDASLQVRLDAPDWRLRFRVTELHFTNQKGQPHKLADVVWVFVKNSLNRQFEQLSVNLLPAVTEMREALPRFYEPEDQERIVAFLQSLRPGKIAVTAEAMVAEILANIDLEGVPVKEIVAEEALSTAELEEFLRTWETWDAFLVLQIRRLARYGLTPDEQAEVFRVLLDTRYQLAIELADEYFYGGPDIVRAQFMAAWERLAPIFRNHMGSGTKAEPMSALVYVSAVDALAVLDKVGPQLGLEISRDGLVRLARFLVAQGAPINLGYSFEPDVDLRKIMGWGNAPEATGPLFSGQELDWREPQPDQPTGDEDGQPEPADANPGGGVQGRFFGAGRCYTFLRPVLQWLAAGVDMANAAEPPPVDPQTVLKPWLPDRANYWDYLAKVHELVREEVTRLTSTGTLAPDKAAFFEKLINATVWQESCFRQFLVKQGKITYLRSWNNTSVGMMQINERVWRGFYQVEALRWDPRYNIQAGTEIVWEYLSRYIFPKAAPVGPLDDDGMARATYAIYNAGPTGLKAFLTRHASKEYSKIDQLFWSKFEQTKNGKFEGFGGCL